MSQQHGWVGVDLDGVLAHYDGWKGADHIGEPIPAMVGRVKGWLAEGKTVKIMTARVHPNQEAKTLETVRYWIEHWCLNHVGQKLEITHEKDYGMVELWDDRAVQVIPNTGRTVGELADKMASAFEVFRQAHVLEESGMLARDETLEDVWLCALQALAEYLRATGRG